MRKIAFLTGSRGEWGYIRPILRAIEKDDELTYELIATQMLLLPEFGLAVKEIERDGFRVSEKVYMTLDGFNAVTMTKSLGVLMLELPTILDRIKPDILLLSGDRGEQLMGAIAGGHLGIPVAHIQAGELSGNIDGIVRHSITKLAHIHFAANEEFADRVRKMGEQPFRVYNTGAPQLDEMVKGNFTADDELRSKFRLAADDKFILAVQHPVTEQEDKAGEHILETLNAIKRTKLPTVMIYPNADAGSELVRKELQNLKGSNIQVYRNLPRVDYLGLMRSASLIVGNSSSGILEAPTFKLPCVNIGRRQIGRPQAINVINSEHSEEAIFEAIQIALSGLFQRKMENCVNPYGDGQSAQRIKNILKDIKIDSGLINKKMSY
jgi:GDP/UDP-N,N'-diacetylbacillosamine 2-epimerase (hydrolysing)